MNESQERREELLRMSHHSDYCLKGIKQIRNEMNLYIQNAINENGNYR